MTSASTAQIGAIHSIAKRAGMTEVERRGLIASVADGKTSCRQLSQGEAIAVIDRLRSLQGGISGPAARGASELAGPYAPKLRALWLSGWNLGVVHDRTDRALLAFLTRQTGLEHTRFLRDAAAAQRVIEALKSWLAREAGVEWPGGGGVEASKLAVYRAQSCLLAAHGLPMREPSPSADTDVDAEIRVAGTLLRKAIKRAGNGK